MKTISSWRVVAGISAILFAEFTLAGSAPITFAAADGLSLSDGFEAVQPATESQVLAQAQIAASQSSAVIQSIARTGRVRNPTGECIAVAPEKIAVISDAVQSRQSGVSEASRLLQEQIQAELEGESINVEILDYSAGSYIEAAESANQFVTELDSELLEVAMYSPTLMVILDSLGARMNLVDESAAGRFTCAAEADSEATERQLFAQDLTDPASLGLIKISLSP